FYLSYSSLQYFSKQFKKATGMSPLEYLNSVKKYSNEITHPSKQKKS
ncbi:MAG: AraC family transcriptional regulator, partial [Acetivibrio sp.]